MIKKRIPVLFAAICVSGMLVVSSWPKFVGGAIVAPYQSTLRDLTRGRKVPDATLINMGEALRVSRRWYDHGSFSINLGGERMMAARKSQSAAAQRKILSESIAALRHGLARMPGQPYAWLQLAQAARARDGAKRYVENYLALSLRLAPWEHRLVMPRLNIALGIWRVLGSEFKATLPRQFERAVDTAPVALAQAARRNFALGAVRQMLAGSPVHLQRFQIVYLSPD